MVRMISVPVVLAVAAIGAAVVSAPAQAQRHYHGHVPSSGFAGERALTGALREVQLAHEDVHFSHQRSHVLSAMHQVSIAQSVVRSPLAQREMSHAYEHLDEFLHHGSHRDLDLAAAHLQTAYDVARPVVVHRPPVVVHRPPVVRPVPPPVIVAPHPVPPVHHGGGISFGNGKFQVRIGF